MMMMMMMGAELLGILVRGVTECGYWERTLYCIL
jgi:hypothetical protein